MLEPRIAESHAAARAVRRDADGIRVLVEGPDDLDATGAAVLVATTTDLLDGSPLLDECFGPTSIVVEYADDDELLAAAQQVEGSLTATIHSEPEDAALVERLVRELSTRAGRLVFNGWPTGVRVTWAMQHGGPWPATTAPGYTSVGAAAIDRFTRPVAFQNTSQQHLPRPLRDRNHLGVVRRIDGVLSTADVAPGGRA
jgi:NADP-dependent aldehyde dehydrogenase